jgi:hypothetical protein
MAPHATDDGNMSNKSTPMTNGETPSSKVLSVCTTLFPDCSIRIHPFQSSSAANLVIEKEKKGFVTLRCALAPFGNTVMRSHSPSFPIAGSRTWDAQPAWSSNTMHASNGAAVEIHPTNWPVVSKLYNMQDKPRPMANEAGNCILDGFNAPPLNGSPNGSTVIVCN